MEIERDISGVGSETEVKYLINFEKSFDQIKHDMSSFYGEPQRKLREWFYFDFPDYSLTDNGSTISLRSREEVSNNNTNYMLTFKLKEEDIRNRLEFNSEFEAIKTKDQFEIKGIIFGFFDKAYHQISNLNNNPKLKVQFDSNLTREIQFINDKGLGTFQSIAEQFAADNRDINLLNCVSTFWVESYRFEICLSYDKSERIEVSCDKIYDIGYYDAITGVGRNIKEQLFEVEVEVSSKSNIGENKELENRFQSVKEDIEYILQSRYSLVILNKNKYQRVMELK